MPIALSLAEQFERLGAGYRSVFAALQQINESELNAKIQDLAEESSTAAGVEALVTYAPPIAAYAYIIRGIIDDFEFVRTQMRTQNTAQGFAQGLVMGLLGWRWQQVVDHFGRGYLDVYVQKDLNRIRVAAYNFGLRLGYYFAARLSIPVRVAYLKTIRKDSGASKGDWSRAARISYVIELAASFRKTFMTGLNVLG